VGKGERKEKKKKGRNKERKGERNLYKIDIWSKALAGFPRINIFDIETEKGQKCGPKTK
jgi:hypothetical protein